MSDTRCQAAAMDAAAMLGSDLLHDGASVPPCDEPGEVERHGFMLCVGCSEALDALLAVGRAIQRKRGGS